MDFFLFLDFNKEVFEVYGVMYDEFFGMKGVFKCFVFVVDKEGVIWYVEVFEDVGNFFNFEVIKEILS